MYVQVDVVPDVAQFDHDCESVQSRMHEEFDRTKDTTWTRNVPKSTWVQRAYRQTYQTHGAKVAQQAIYNLLQALNRFDKFPQEEGVDAFYFTGKSGLSAVLAVS